MVKASVAAVVAGFLGALAALSGAQFSAVRAAEHRLSVEHVR
jgi:hypothetical protein